MTEFNFSELEKLLIQIVLLVLFLLAILRVVVPEIRHVYRVVFRKKNRKPSL